MKKSIQILFLLNLLFFGVAGYAQDIEENRQDTIKEEIEEVTITAFRSPYNIFNTPAPVNMITSLKLETGSSFTPIEALNHVPGILMHHGTLNTNRLTIRGIGSRTPYASNKIKAYLGEIPLTSGDGETVLEDIENNFIKRIEVIKGPSSSLYGAGLAGVILFHPKSVSENFAQNQVTISSFRTVKNTLSTGLKNKNLNLYALGSILSSDGYRENNQTKRANILINSYYNFSDNTNLQLLLKTTKMDGHIPSSIDLDTYETSPKRAASNWNAIQGYEEYTNGQFGISFNHITDKLEKISVGTFGSFRVADELRPFNRLDENSNFIGWRAYIQKVVRFENARYTFTSGLEFYRERYNWKTISNENRNEILSKNIEKRQYENLFFQMESAFDEKLFVSMGVNGNLTRFDYEDRFHDNGDLSAKHSYKPVISPRLGVNFLVNEEWSLFGNISHGFSTPSFEETLRPEGEVNPDIEPESGWNLEFGIRSSWTERVQFTASYYRIFIKNLLVARRTGEDAYIGVNAGKSMHPGLEAEITWQVTNPKKYPSLVLNGNTTVANYHFSEFKDEGNDYSGKNLPGTTKNTWLAMANLKINAEAMLNLWYRYTGEMPLNDNNSGYSDKFGITNAEIRFAPPFEKMRLEIKGGIQNLFDVKHASMILVNAPSFGGKPPRFYYPGNPRNYYISLLIGL